MYTSLIFSTGMPDFSTADLMATAPSCGAGTETKEPLNWGSQHKSSQKVFRNRRDGTNLGRWRASSAQDVRLLDLPRHGAGGREGPPWRADAGSVGRRRPGCQAGSRSGGRLQHRENREGLDRDRRNWNRYIEDWEVIESAPGATSGGCIAAPPRTASAGSPHRALRR